MHFHLSQNLSDKPVIKPNLLTSSKELRRESAIFFVGADLPIFETVETIIESHPGSVELFVIVFGTPSMVNHNLEMIRLIKRNFPVRTVVILNFPISRQTVEQVFAAGGDGCGLFLDVGEDLKLKLLSEISKVFPESSTVAFLSENFWKNSNSSGEIEKLVSEGVIPIPVTNPEKLEDAEYIRFEMLLKLWRQNFQIAPFASLISLLTPFKVSKKDGFLRGVAKHIKNRHELAKNQLERHLRFIPAENSLDSAGL